LVPTDLVVKVPTKAPRVPKVAVFDMDGTVIEQESLVVLAEIAGLQAEVAELTGRAMRGEMGFEEAVAERVKLLGGCITPAALKQAATQCTYRKGFEKFATWLKQNGCKLVLNTGGFDWLADKIAKDQGMDACFSNKMCWEDGKLIGVELKSLVDGRQKAANLTDFCTDHGIDLSDVACFGDGANDIPMLQLVQQSGGLAVAVAAKQVVKEITSTHIKDFVGAQNLF